MEDSKGEYPTAIVSTFPGLSCREQDPKHRDIPSNNPKTSVAAVNPPAGWMRRFIRFGPSSDGTCSNLVLAGPSRMSQSADRLFYKKHVRGKKDAAGAMERPKD